MNITDIKIRKIYEDDSRLRALVSITVDDEFAIHDIKVIQGQERYFVAMPSRREENGTFRDIAHPIKADVRQSLEEKILAAYLEHLSTISQTQPESDTTNDPILS